MVELRPALDDGERIRGRASQISFFRMFLSHLYKLTHHGTLDIINHIMDRLSMTLDLRHVALSVFICTYSCRKNIYSQDCHGFCFVLHTLRFVSS